MPLWSLTQERVEKLLRQIGDKEMEVDTLIKLTKEDLWKKDLDDFIAEWKFQLEDERQRARSIVKGRRASKKFKIAARGPPVKKRKGLGDDLDDSDFDMPKPKKMAKAPKDHQLPKIIQGPKANPWAAFVPTSRKASTDGASDEIEMLDGIKNVALVQKNTKAGPRPRADEMEAHSDLKVVPKSKPVKLEDNAKEEAKRPAARQARAVAKKAVKYAGSSDSDSDNGDDMLGDVTKMVKGLPVVDPDPLSESRPFFSASFSRPGSSAGYKAASKAPSKGPIDLSDDETDYTKLVPQQSPRRSILITARESNITDDEDDDIRPISVKPRPIAKAPSVEPKAGRVVAAAAWKKVKKDVAKKPSVGPSKKGLHSPVAKAYAKRLAKKQVMESDEEIAAIADDILDSPASDESIEDVPPPRKAAARPARRAAAATKKPSYAFDDDDDDESDEGHVDEGSSAMYSESE